MASKDVIIGYQQAERIKSGLIIASKLLSTLEGLKGSEKNGAEKLFKAYLASLRNEMRLAFNVTRSDEFLRAEDKIDDVMTGRDADTAVSQAISLVTTACANRMNELIAMDLL